MECSSLKAKFHMFLRSLVKNRETSMTIIPEEIIFTILILLPDHLLHNVMRYVCRQWHRIIADPQFVTAHCFLSSAATSSSTLLMHHRQPVFYHLIDARECPAKRTGYKFDLPYCTYMRNTCNGLMLITKDSGEAYSNTYKYYVINPVTRKMLELPQLSLRTLPHHCCLAFEASSKVYKVAVVYSTEKHSYGPAILTVGVDEEWRIVNCAHLEKYDMEILSFGYPVTSTGLVYWGSSSRHNIVALDIKSESIKTIRLPYAYGSNYVYVPKENSISIWYLIEDSSMEAWLLKDHMNEDWVKILSIDVKAIRNQLDKPFPMQPKYINLRPRCWLGNDDEKIIFQVTSNFFIYDVKTCCCSLFLENDSSCNSKLVPFVSTLAWVC